MKLAPIIMLLVIIQVTIMFYTGAYSEETYGLDPYNSSTIINNTGTAVWDFIADPTDWSATDVLTTIAGIIGIAGAFAVGVYLITKSDTVLFMPIAMMFFGFGAIPMISLYNVFMNNSSIFGCTSIEPCSIAIMAFISTAGLIGLFYVLAVLEWWSGRPTS